MTKKFFLSLFIVFSFLQNTLTANIHPDPGHFGLQGELLYLKSSNPSSFYGLQQISFTPTFELKSLYMKEKYKPGYRLEGVYAFDCSNILHGRVTYFNSGNNTRTVDGSFAVPGFSGTLTNNEKFRFCNAELLYGRWLIDDCDFQLEMQMGVLYSYVNFRDLTTITGPFQPLSTGITRSSYWGVGPEFVVNCKYDFLALSCGTIGFSSDMRIALLAGENKAIQIGADNFTSSSDPINSLNPAFDLRLGLNWEYLSNCITFDLEAGYEWIYSNRTYTSNNISFSGPYLAASFTF